MRAHHGKVTDPLNTTSTYFAEVWSEMDNWLKQNCAGAFSLISPTECWFDDPNDLSRWKRVWHGENR